MKITPAIEKEIRKDVNTVGEYLDEVNVYFFDTVFQKMIKHLWGHKTTNHFPEVGEWVAFPEREPGDNTPISFVGKSSAPIRYAGIVEDLSFRTISASESFDLFEIMIHLKPICFPN